ncbi:MAG: 2-C-methyl-D-erythritol 4-phosphate cytidylyltransferase [Thermoanaerobaculia bacterium]
MSDGESSGPVDSLEIPVHAVVPAAGTGLRFGGEVPKQFRDLAGQPVLRWAVERLLAGGVTSVTVALSEEVLGSLPGWLRDAPGVSCVAGGGTRQASVALALAVSPAAADDLVLVHDGARPTLHRDDLLAVVGAAAAGGCDGAILGRSLADTLKRVEDGWVLGTVARERLFRAETPQVFRRRTLERAFELAAADRFVGTDEASVVERISGVRIAAVEARHPNPKVTTPADLLEVEALFRGVPR